MIDPEIQFPELRLGEHQTEMLKKLGCPPGHMPFTMQPVNPNWGVVFAWTHWNLFQPKGKWQPAMPAMFDSCVGQPRWKVLVKLFGWIERQGRTAFGSFNPAVHILPHEKVREWMRTKKWTSYLKVDPHVARSYAMVWHFVDENGIGVTFDESPAMAEGEWVDVAGGRGEGQWLYGGRGVNFYKKYIREREREHGQESFRKFGDPRAFATQAAAAEGGTSLFELFANDDSAKDKDLAPMFFEPAKIRASVKLDLSAFGSLLDYDPDKPITVENQPQHYVSDRCQNFIRSLLNYQLPEDGGPADNENVWKDFIDAGARYGFGEPCGYYDQSAPQVSGGGAWT